MLRHVFGYAARGEWPRTLQESLMFVLQQPAGGRDGMETKARKHVIITGRVQGVFYRMETKRAADRYGVFGWVKNRPDGSVEGVFEGDEKKVAALIEWCRRGPRHAEVIDVVAQDEVYTAEFREFYIAY